MTLKKGTELTLNIESLAYGGQGLARVDDFVVFIRYAIPGQSVRARIVKKRKSYAEARLLEVLKKSEHTVETPCEHFGVCGGCAFQQLDYQVQCKEKGRQVFDLIERVAGLHDFERHDTLPSPDVFRYRNKMEFSFSDQRWLTRKEIDSGSDIEREPLYVGMHARGFYDKVVTINECHLCPPVTSQILARVRKVALESGLPAYSTRTHTGFWRFCVIRTSHNTDDIMVNVITSRHEPGVADALKSELEAVPQITSLINGITASKSSVAYCKTEHLLKGESVITEKLGELTFQLSSNSFFQTNTRQAGQLYAVIRETAEFKPDDTVFDLYCGAGSIALYISGDVRQVTGFESVRPAVDNAVTNAELNNISNCEFVCTDLMHALKNADAVLERYGRPDVVILDPPRGGMHPKTVEAVLRYQPRRIVHVSCNPATLARELQTLCATDYRLVSVQPVDMFPHTAHVESVSKLERVGE